MVRIRYCLRRLGEYLVSFFSKCVYLLYHIAISYSQSLDGHSFILFRQREKKQTMSRHNGIPLLDESRSFSLIFRGAKTLDLMVDGFGDREKILYVLNSIVTEYSRAKVKVGNEVLLLRYVWNDVDRVSYTCFTHISLCLYQA